MGLGINLVAHANLGTSALTLIPLVINELVPLSFGELTMIFNIILVISQVILLGKSFPLLQYFQLIVSFVLGVSVDFWGPMIQNLELNAGEYVEDVMSVIDGLILIGGHDVSPLVYKQEPRKKIGTIKPDRDTNDAVLFQGAVEKGIPVLGVCIRSFSRFLGTDDSKS